MTAGVTLFALEEMLTNHPSMWSAAEPTARTRSKYTRPLHHRAMVDGVGMSTWLLKNVHSSWKWAKIQAICGSC